MGRVKISPEADFLAFCCREDRDWAGTRQRASAILNWEGAVNLSTSHGIAPWLLPLLEEDAGGGSMPDWVASEIRSAAIQDIARVAYLRSALRKILPALHQSGVQVIVLKGAALVALIYGDPSLRPAQDIDLLCREEDYERVHQVLVSLGYPARDAPSLPHRCSPLETFFERHFSDPDELVPIELHVDSIKLGVKPRHSETIWDRARPIEIEGAPTLALALEDQVLMLSVHLHRHGFNRLIWFKDIDLLIRRYGDELDWELILAEASAEGAASSLWYTFCFLDKLLGTPIPANVLEALKPNAIIRWAFSRIWPESAVRNLRGQTRRRAVQFSVLESWRGTVPSLLLMGRKPEKVSILLHRVLSSWRTSPNHNR